MIGDDIEVTVLSLAGEKVRLGIQAPSDVPVYRNEIYLEIQREHGARRATARHQLRGARSAARAREAERHRLGTGNIAACAAWKGGAR